MTTRLSLTEYRKRPNERKDIYAYIHTLVRTILELVQSEPDSVAKQTMKAILDSNGAYWNALEVAT